MSCDHPRDSMKWVKEGAFKGICTCTACGEQFEVGGWAVRGALGAVTFGVTRGAARGAISSTFHDITKK